MYYLRSYQSRKFVTDLYIVIKTLYIYSFMFTRLREGIFKLAVVSYFLSLLVNNYIQ